MQDGCLNKHPARAKEVSEKQFVFASIGVCPNTSSDPELS